MAINISAKNDYSYLFSSLSSSSSSSSLGNLSFLSDYASIKNGSYAKLMKAYYSQNASDEVSSIAGTSTSADASKDLTVMQSSTDALKESADALLETGSKSIFTKKEVTTTEADGTTSTSKEYDAEAIYSAVSTLIDDYNSVLEASNNISSEGILKKVANMVSSVSTFESTLAKVGITVGTDGTLEIDKDTFLKSDMTTVKSLFNGNSSLSYRLSAQSSLINFATTNEVNRSNTYTQSGTYSSTYSSGNLFSDFF